MWWGMCSEGCVVRAVLWGLCRDGCVVRAALCGLFRLRRVVRAVPLAPASYIYLLDHDTTVLLSCLLLFA